MSEIPYDAGMNAPAKEAKPTAQPPIESMRYLECYSFVFSSSNWFMNLLLGSVCLLLPVVGQIVFVGYEFELIEALHRGRRKGYADFDFNRFSDYLKRGVWPWLVAFLAQLVIQIPLMILIYGGMFGVIAALATQTTAGYVTAAVVVPVVFIAVLVISLAFGLALTPLFLRAGLTQEFGKAFDMNWIKQFIGLMWVEQLLAGLFMSVTAMMWILLGEMMFCIGVFPASVVVSLASTYLIWQMYEIFLSRGGEPIPFKEEIVHANVAE